MSVKSNVLIGTAAVATIAFSGWIIKTVSRHGVEKTLRFLWEGDYYPPDMRNAMNELDKVENNIEEECILEALDESLARARLNSLDDDSFIEPEWIIAHAPRNLEKDLAKVSHDLDTLAASVDAVPSYGNVELKTRKKRASEQVVRMMARADVMLAIYKQQQQDTDDIK